MRSYWEENAPALCAKLDGLLELGVQEAHAHSVGFCARCAEKGVLTYLDLCPACFKAAYDGQLVRTDRGRWVKTDIMFMRTVIQGPRKAEIKELEARLTQDVPHEMASITLIAAERKRQVEQEGWTPEHDAKHTKGQLAQAAACYCIVKPGPAEQVDLWPWGSDGFKRSGAPLPSIRDLVKAGALIAAEIDRRLAAGEVE